jgi:DnaA-homolog protein
VTEQMSLDLRLRDSASFENFCVGNNRELTERLQRAVADDRSHASVPLFLWGESGSGKSHLLQAVCRAAQIRGQVPVYVPLGSVEITPAVLEDAEQTFLVCLDDVQAIARQRDWEIALFALYERARASGTRLVAAATAAPASLGLAMPDLATRFGWGTVYQLHALDDAGKLEALCLRAANQGFELSIEVARYILSRYPRDLHTLFALLERLDRAALASQRRVTVPFIQSLERAVNADDGGRTT